MIKDILPNIKGVEGATVIAWRALNGAPDTTGSSLDNILPFMRRAIVTSGYSINQHYGKNVVDSDQMYIHIELNRTLPAGKEVVQEYDGHHVYAGFKKE